jgi:hypothetical protein
MVWGHGNPRLGAKCRKGGDVEQIKGGHGDLVQMDWDPISRIVLAKGSP